MSSEYLLPALPLGCERATVVRWLKRPGDPVAAGDPLLIVVSERAEVALPAVADSILELLLVPEGANAEAGAALALIVARSPDADMAGADTTGMQAGAPVARSARPEPARRTLSRTARRASPVALRIAATEDIDISKTAGSGPSGRVLKRDVLAALKRRRSATDRSGISAAVIPTLASAGAPFALTAMEVDLGRVVATRAELAGEFARRGLALTDPICMALCVVSALARHPLLNSIWGDQVIVSRRRIHLAVNGDVPGSLVRDAQDLNLRGLARAIGRGWTTGSSADRAADATFRIAFRNGSIWFDPLALWRPATAALGVGRVGLRPIVVADRGVDRIAVRPTALLTLAYDARVLDQSHADAFLRDVQREIDLFGATPR
jgi:pyruvate/2-oxoglutarate dehydrogenase complex dihydrolipoamide acyltransferase (E2) component